MKKSVALGSQETIIGDGITKMNPSDGIGGA